MAQRRYSQLRLSAMLIAACLGLAAGFTALQPDRFAATCVLQIERESYAEPAASPLDEVARDEWFRTQAFLISSRRVVERVARTSHLEPSTKGARGHASPASSDTIKEIQDSIALERVAHTRLVRLTVSDASGSRATYLANAISAAYLDAAVEARLLSQQRAQLWLAQELQKVATRLQGLDGELATFIRAGDEGELDLERENTRLSQEITRLTQALTEARLQRIAAGARLTKLKSAQRDNPFDVHTAEVDGNQQALELQAAYQSLILRLGEVEASQDADSTKRDLLTSRIPPLSDRLRRVIEGIVQSARLEVVEVESVETQLHGELTKARVAAQKLQRRQLELSRLTRERASATSTLDTLQERSTRLGTALGTSDAHVVEKAEPPIRPSDRPWARNLALGAMVGLLVLAAWKRLRAAQEAS